jgi:hypothetical protein
VGQLISVYWKSKPKLASNLGSQPKPQTGYFRALAR